MPPDPLVEEQLKLNYGFTLISQGLKLEEAQQTVEHALQVVTSSTTSSGSSTSMLTHQPQAQAATRMSSGQEAPEQESSGTAAAHVAVQAAAGSDDESSSSTMFLVQKSDLIAILCNTLGYIAYQVHGQQTQMALDFFLRSASFADKNPYPWNNAGVMALVMGDFQKAQTSFQHAVALSQATTLPFPRDFFTTNLLCVQQLIQTGQTSIQPNLGLYFYGFT